MPGRTRYAVVALALLLLSGCARSSPIDTARETGIDPEAPVAAGHGPMPRPGEPTPLGDRPLSGLYANPPSADTVSRLAEAPLSPDGLFRAVFNEGEAWVTRVDGAWLWRIAVPAVPPANPQQQGGQSAAGATAGQAGSTPAGAGQPGSTPAGADQTAPGQAAQAQAGAGQAGAGQTAAGQITEGQAGAGPAGAAQAPAAVVPPLQWTPQSTLLFRDSGGRWYEANPATALVTPLAPAFQGAENLTPSPDGSRVLYYKGNQLFTALRDGSQPQLVGANLTGRWDSAGQLVTSPVQGVQRVQP